MTSSPETEAEPKVVYADPDTNEHAIRTTDVVVMQHNLLSDDDVKAAILAQLGYTRGNLPECISVRRAEATFHGPLGIIRRRIMAKIRKEQPTCAQVTLVLPFPGGSWLYYTRMIGVMKRALAGSLMVTYRKADQTPVAEVRVWCNGELR